MDNKNKKNFNFISQVLILFAVTVLLLTIIASLFGEEAKSISDMYQFGSKGLAISTLLQFFLCSVMIISFKSLFFSEKIIRSMMMLWRTVLLLLSIFISMIIFIVVFHWFPIGNPYALIGFFVCFGGGFILCASFMIIKTKLDNKRYSKLLSLYKNQHGDELDNE